MAGLSEKKDKNRGRRFWQKKVSKQITAERWTEKRKGESQKDRKVIGEKEKKKKKDKLKEMNEV